MRRGLLAGIAVVIAAVVLAVILFTKGEEEPLAEGTVAPESQPGIQAESSESTTETQAQEPSSEGAASETGKTSEVTIREVVRATPEGVESQESAQEPEPQETLQPEPQETLQPEPQETVQEPESLETAEPAGGAPSLETAPEESASSEAVSGEATSDEGIVQSGDTETEIAALPPEAAPPPLAPLFDIVRVEPDGQAVIAGRAEPGSLVILLDGDREIGRATADSTGAWVMILGRPLGPGDHQLGLRAEMADGSVLLSETLVIVSVPEPPLVVASGEAEEAEEQIAAAPAEEATPLAVETPRQDLGATRILQQPEDAGLRDQALLLNAVDYDADGFLVISGRAQPGARVIVYLDEVPLGTVAADGDGYWQLAPEQPVASGLHRLRVDQVDDTGDVLARVATLFSRAELAGGFPEDRYVIVQPGNSLWRIARRTYGEGVRYSVIYQANNDQIGDPDLIFPGQIFLVPSEN